MTRSKKFFAEMWAAFLDMWTANLSLYKRAGAAVARWPKNAKRWWRDLYHREYIRRTRRIHSLHVWVRGEDEGRGHWVNHYYRDADLIYTELTWEEAEALGDELIVDGHNLGLQLQARSEVNRKYVI